MLQQSTTDLSKHKKPALERCRKNVEGRNVMLSCNLYLALDVIKMFGKKPSEETDYDDFFSRFDFINYQDPMDDFKDK